jgi:hypothetical protein
VGSDLTKRSLHDRNGYSIVTPLALIIAAQFSTSLPMKVWR